MTTSGGGMYLTDDEDAACRVRHLATQAREPAVHYEHRDIGYNYRLSNLLAAMGNAQLRRLDEMIARRRARREAYARIVQDVPGVEVFQRDGDEHDNCWLTALVVDPELAGFDAASLSAALTAAGIEGAEVSVRLAALVADADPGPVARSHLVTVCRAAEQQGHRISLDPEGARGAGAGLALAQDLHAEFRGTLGVQLPAHLHRAETDAQLLAEKGMRVRLVRLSVRPVADAAHVEPAAVDRSFVRCLRILMEGAGTPVIATHDPRLLAIGADLVRRQHREATAQEFLLDHRMHPVDRRRLIAAGLLVRTNLPYGEDWSCYLARRLTEDPGGLSELPRGLVHRTD